MILTSSFGVLLIYNFRFLDCFVETYENDKIGQHGLNGIYHLITVSIQFLKEYKSLQAYTSLSKKYYLEAEKNFEDNDKFLSAGYLLFKHLLITINNENSSEEFYKSSLKKMVREDRLGFISVYSPSFLIQLNNVLRRNWDEIVPNSSSLNKDTLWSDIFKNVKLTSFGNFLRKTKQDEIPTIVSLHQVDLAKAFADRIIGLNDGEVVFDGPPSELGDAALDRIYDRKISGELGVYAAEAAD